MNLILLKNYNNYYNRIVKKYSTVSDYALNYTNGTVTSVVNWNPNDGVNTEQIINWNKGWDPDYLVAYNDDYSIDSRWFVIDPVRTRNGQYKVTLHRDAVADHLETILEAPMFVEKATIQSVDDVAIYNQEDITFNQIKQSETLLKDKTGVGWIVGYIAENTPDTTINVIDTSVDKISVSSLSGWQYYNYITNPYKQVNTVNSKVNLKYTYHPTSPATAPFYIVQIDTNGNYQTIGQTGTNTYALYAGATANSQVNAGVAATNRDNIFDAFFLGQSTYKKDLPGFLNLEGRYLYDQDTGKLYKITFTTSSSTESVVISNSSSTASNIAGLFSGLSYIASASSNSFIVDAAVTNYQIVLEEVNSQAAYSFTLPASSKKLADAPYRMFCIPYGKMVCQWHVFYTLDELGALNLAASLARDLGNNLYDIQLLPYCPATDMINGYGYIDVTGLTEGTDFTGIKDSNNTYFEIILYPSYSNFSFDITKTINLPASIVERKVEGQCNNYRLCSPNYAAMFDFNLLKTGSIKKFNVDCTYKPYSPYIHVNPDFGNLYGQDFNDVRGLICQGDFSLPIVTDQWNQYQINNKNYLNSFNRQVESIELQNKYAKQQDIANAITGSISGGIAGMSAGSAGGGWGAAIGAVVGTAMSGAAGAYDTYINELLRREALDLSKDQFNYNLQNIQALPYTLGKVSTFDYNNKIFPVLEFYTCTDQEKEIFRNKMTYNGMTIMRIDKLINFKSNDLQFMKGKIIRFTDLSEDYHKAAVIADEINKGVYI